MTEKNYSLYSDGGARGNPGPAAFAFIILDASGAVVKQEARYIGETTNNQAEYQGIVAALEAWVSLGLDGSLTCYLDSQLVVRQINGQYKVKNSELKPWYDRVLEMKNGRNSSMQFVDIPRSKNQIADRLLNEVLDERK